RRVEEVRVESVQVLQRAGGNVLPRLLDLEARDGVVSRAKQLPQRFRGVALGQPARHADDGDGFAAFALHLADAEIELLDGQELFAAERHVSSSSSKMPCKLSRTFRSSSVIESESSSRRRSASTSSPDAAPSVFGVPALSSTRTASASTVGNLKSSA